MFTGLIEFLGTVTALRDDPNGRRLSIAMPAAGDLAIGDSVAINGCCLTVVAKSPSTADFEAGPETLQKTNLGKLAVGIRVNLERAMLASGRLGGHIVQGHVDGVAAIESRQTAGQWETIWFTAGELTKTMIAKGSVAVDGISLTVVDVTEKSFSVALIPHTLAVTTLGFKAVGETVNIETDLIGKYVYKYLGQIGGGLTVNKLRAAGFIE